MNTSHLELNIPDISQLTIRINGTQYRLTPVETSDHGPIPTLKAHLQQRDAELRQQGRHRTAETYRTAVNRFLRFHTEPDISFAQFTPQLIQQYEQQLRASGISSNTSSFYMRVLRTLYNQAVALGYTTDCQPFRPVYTGMARTVKRAISLQALCAISQLQLTERHEAFARDMFLFSLYTRGMAFVDMAYLTPDNLRNGILTYRRHKTGQRITMRWEQQMQDILDRNPTDNSHYLLPIIKRNNGCERSQYRESQRLVNAMLKTIGQKVGLHHQLTMYVARHSWATTAQNMGSPISAISQAMGHVTENTTHVYLKGIDNSHIDNMNATLIRTVSDPTSPISAEEIRSKT